MDTLPIIEWAVLVAAIAIMVSAIVSMTRSGKAETMPEGETADGDGFGKVSRPQRVVYGAGLGLSFWLVWVFFLLIGIAAALMAMDRFLIPSWLGFLIALLVPYSLWSVLREIARRRAVRFEEKLIDAVDLIISVLRCGETPRKSLEGVAQNGEQPVRREFRFLVRRLEFGMGMHRALRPMVQGYDSEGLRLFANTIAAKFNVGGDIIPVLIALNKVLRDRHRHRVRVFSQLTGSKLASLLIAGSPYVIFAFYIFQKPEWIDRLFSTTLGTTLFVGAVCFQILGFVWLNRLSRAEV